MSRRESLYKNKRGYTARIVALNDDRVIYHCWKPGHSAESKPVTVQNNFMRAPEDFFREWF